MATTATTRLPASFTTVYRLFLRTCSASVLHHQAAKRNLRQLWRPTFVAAAKIVRELQADPKGSTSRNAKEEWLRIWERRIDNTLALLYTSCKSRGLPHELTRNLSLLVTRERARMLASHRKTWTPHLPPTSPQYQPTKLNQKDLSKKEKLKRTAAFEASAWDPLRQVVKMAEGRDGISLGRIEIRRRLWWRRNMEIFPRA